MKMVWGSAIFQDLLL